MQNARLDEAQAGIKIAGRNINNLRYVNDTTLMTESENKLSLLRVKEESEKAGLKLSVQKQRFSPFFCFGEFLPCDLSGNCCHDLR